MIIPLLFDLHYWRIFLVFATILAISRGKSLNDSRKDGYRRSERASEDVCPSGSYLDKVTGQCDLCAPHCQWALETLPTGCRAFCHQNMPSPIPKKRKTDTIDERKGCSEGFYFDPGTSNCDPCMPHCKRIPLEQPPGNCVSYCGKLATTTPAPTAVPSLGPKPKETTISTGAIVAIGACALIMVVAAIGLILIRRHRRRQQRQAIVLNDDTIEQNEHLKPSVPEETTEGERTSKLVTATSTV